MRRREFSGETERGVQNFKVAGALGQASLADEPHLASLALRGRDAPTP